MIYINAYDYNDLNNAVNFCESDDVTITIQNDILISTPLSIDTKSSHKFIINGNHKKIYEYNESDAIQSEEIINGRNYATYLGSVSGEETFTTSDGTVLQLAKSDVFAPVGDWTIINNQMSMSVSQDMDIDTNNTFIAYQEWYYRRLAPVTSWLPDGNLTFDGQIEEYASAWTTRPKCFLVNYGSEANGVLIKNSTISWTSQFQKIHKCTCDHILFIIKNSIVEIHDLLIIGSFPDYAIRNDGHLKMTGCTVSNVSGGGVCSYFRFFSQYNIFENIKNTAVHTECLLTLLTNSQLPYAEIKYNQFRNIGHYGSNDFGVFSEVKAIIAHNDFLDTNYGAISIGKIETEDSFLRDLCENLVEHNLIHYTNDWIREREKLGLQDSGAIYVATNNKKATIRYNTILDCGGLGTNRGILCDDGAYNMDIYCNVISRTQNSYDIDSRECAANVRPTPEGSNSETSKISTCNYIGYNVCDGYLRLQAKNNDISGSNCYFSNNIKLHKFINEFIPSKEFHYNQLYFSIIFDWTGYIIRDNSLFSTFDYSILNIESTIVN